MKSQAIVFTGVHRAEIMEFELPPPGDGQALIRVRASCVSPGTELRCLAGLEGGADAFPFIPGYAAAGVVLEAGKNSGCEAGDRVVCNGTRRAASLRRLWGGHVRHAVADAPEIVRIPDGTAFDEAALAVVMAIPLRGARLASPKAGEKASVVGLGLIGSLSARIFRALGADVVGFDLSEERVDIARAAGPRAEMIAGPLAAGAKRHRPEGADIVVDCSGAAELTGEAMTLCRELSWEASDEAGPRFVFQGSLAGEARFPYGTAFARELTVLFPRDRRRADVEESLALMAARKIAVTPRDMIRFDPADAGPAYERLRAGALGGLTAVFDWGG